MLIPVLVGAIIFGLVFIAAIGMALRGHHQYQQRVDQDLRYRQAHQRYKQFLQMHEHSHHRDMSARPKPTTPHVIPPAMDLEIQIQQDGTVNELVNGEPVRTVRS